MESGSQARNVLVVEDDPAVRDYLSDALVQLGASVTAVESVGEACTSLRSSAFALVMTDLCLECGSEGLDVVRAARNLVPSARIVLYSGYDLDAVAQEAEDAGVDEILRKPFGLKELNRLLDDLGLARPLPASGERGSSNRLEDVEGQLLLEQYVAGDHSAFERLATAYQPMVLSVFMRWFRLSDIDAEDLYQEVLLQLVRKASTIRNVRMWLVGTAVNQAKKRIRTLIRDRRLVERYMEDLELRSPADDEEDIQELILRGLEALKPFDAQLLSLIYLQGLSYQEVAQILDRPIGSIGPLRGRALKRLTRAITELETPPAETVH